MALQGHVKLQKSRLVANGFFSLTVGHLFLLPYSAARSPQNGRANIDELHDLRHPIMAKTLFRRYYSALIGVGWGLDAVSSSCQLHELLVGAGLINRPVMTIIFNFGNNRLEDVRRDDVPGRCGKGRPPRAGV